MLLRRHFLKGISSLLAGGFAPWVRSKESVAGVPKKVLLRSSWQSVNIGDIGHTPGALALLWKYCPELEITLWPGKLEHGSRDFLKDTFPKLRFAEGSVGKDGKPTTPELGRAWAETSLYLNGSGSGFAGSQHAIAFRRATGKPVGVFGTSTDPVSGFGEGRDPEGGTLESLRERALRLPKNHLQGDLRFVIDEAAFFFCRDTITRDYLRAQGVRTPLVEFGPDAQLGMPMRDDAKGERWLREHGLEAGRFICVIPRLRYTPYHRMRGQTPTEVDRKKDEINDRTTEKDHAKLRDLITRYVRETGNRVMVCAEMTYQVEMGRDVLVQALPAEVRGNVIWRDTYWLPDEAASVYAKASCVVSLECHSPLIALHQGTPIIHVRQPTDTCKGQMYRDIGCTDWLQEVDETDGAGLWRVLSEIVKDPAGARAKVRRVMSGVEADQARMVEAVRRTCGIA
ncbi:MAG: hypothetical protein RIS92_922 [Verrucomicrobiota bacterium]|jgi:hypothetical protein